MCDVTTFPMPDPNPVMNVLLSVTGAGSGNAELTPEALTVRLGRTWHATIPRAAIKTAGRAASTTLSIGAHGWRGDWLVNTTTTALVVLTIEPEAEGRCLGIRIRLRRLRVSLADPDAFLAELGAPAPG